LAENTPQSYADDSRPGPRDIDELAPKVYKQLRKLAENYMRDERTDHTLPPTALVHEAYLRLVNQKSNRFQNRAHFFAAAAQAMRFILVDHAKRRGRKKRIGGRSRVSLPDTLSSTDEPNVDLLALDDALADLAARKPEQASLIELRFFVGLSIAETAEVLGISTASVERAWRDARAWLQKQLSAGDEDHSGQGEGI
jgi:RNA polymerase sigma factor (TIGR02999 family)